MTHEQQHTSQEKKKSNLSQILLSIVTTTGGVFLTLGAQEIWSFFFKPSLPAIAEQGVASLDKVSTTLEDISQLLDSLLTGQVPSQDKLKALRFETAASTTQTNQTLSSLQSFTSLSQSDEISSFFPRTVFSDFSLEEGEGGIYLIDRNNLFVYRGISDEESGRTSFTLNNSRFSTNVGWREEIQTQVGNCILDYVSRNGSRANFGISCLGER